MSCVTQVQRLSKTTGSCQTICIMKPSCWKIRVKQKQCGSDIRWNSSALQSRRNCRSAVLQIFNRISERSRESLAVATLSTYQSCWLPCLDLNFSALPAEEALLGRQSCLGTYSLAFYFIFLLWFWLSPLSSLCPVPQLWARTRLEYVQCRDPTSITFSWAWLCFLSFHQSCLIIVTN